MILRKKMPLEVMLFKQAQEARLEIEWLKPQDIDPLIALFKKNRQNPGFSEMAPHYFEREYVEAFTKNEENGWCLVAKNSSTKEIIGFTMFAPGGIQTLGVDKNFQYGNSNAIGIKNIGKNLLSVIIQHHARNDIEFLTVSSSNNASTKYYKNNGFENIPNEDPFDLILHKENYPLALSKIERSNTMTGNKPILPCLEITHSTDTEEHRHISPE